MDSAHWEALAPVVSSLSVPVLANGDIFVREDIERVRQVSGATSFLIARGALNNASIFREQGMLRSTDVRTEGHQASLSHEDPHFAWWLVSLAPPRLSRIT